MLLRGKSALVTGSSRGIGRSIASAYAHEGAKLAITFNQCEKEAESLVREIRDFGGEAFAQHLDVRDHNEIRHAMEITSDRLGGIDILVNNAGINRVNDFDKQTLEEWNEVIHVNLTGVFLCCQAVLPFIRDHGRIINIGSLSGQYGGPRTPSYAAAKSGLIALTHCVARFVANRGVTVNCLSPGIIESELTDQTMPASLRAKLEPQILLGRLGRYEEVAATAVFLASDGASYITAHTLNVNGGIWF
jgi:3-oxoacyl-[acyl-carrier protein] reductase